LHLFKLKPGNREEAKMSEKSQVNRRRVALYIDLSNMCESDIDWLVRCVLRHGKLATARAYANFANHGFLESAAVKLFLKDVELIHCPGWQNGSGEWKACPDETMMVDILQTLANRPDIGRYIVCTGDGHFVPVLKRIRAAAREAIVIAPSDGASRMLVKVADKFMLVPRPKGAPRPANASTPTGDSREPLAESPLPTKHSPDHGNNGRSRRIPHNGLPPPTKPRPNAA
jgi:hypothetical protein